MDIVDTQIHMGRQMIGATLEAMDAIGITSVLVDEFWHSIRGPHPTHIEPGYVVGNGAWRAASPTAEEASLLHPGRFSYLVRIDPRDAELEALMRTVGSSPNARAFRIQPVWTLEEVQGFHDGAYNALFAIAQDIGLPVCIFIPGYVELLSPYLKTYPRLTVVVDHCGMGFPTIPPGRSAVDEQRVLAPTYFDEVLKLAEFPNVILKWSHAQDRFDTPDYPYTALRPLLRRAIDAFGADRVMWASDKSVMFGHLWSDLVTCVRDDPGLSIAEKRDVLGGTARRVLNWPAPPPVAPSYPVMQQTTPPQENDIAFHDH